MYFFLKNFFNVVTVFKMVELVVTRLRQININYYYFIVKLELVAKLVIRFRAGQRITYLGTFNL